MDSQNHRGRAARHRSRSRSPLGVRRRSVYSPSPPPRSRRERSYRSRSPVDHDRGLSRSDTRRRDDRRYSRYESRRSSPPSDRRRGNGGFSYKYRRDRDSSRENSSRQNESPRPGVSQTPLSNEFESTNQRDSAVNNAANAPPGRQLSIEEARAHNYTNGYEPSRANHSYPHPHIPPTSEQENIVLTNQFHPIPQHVHHPAPSDFHPALEHAGVTNSTRKSPKEPGEDIIEKILSKLKAKGVVDTFRKNYLMNCDTTPEFVKLRERVDKTVKSHLSTLNWFPEMNRNTERLLIRRRIIESSYFKKDLENLLDKCFSESESYFMTEIEDCVYEFLGIEKPEPQEKLAETNDGKEGMEKPEGNGLNAELESDAESSSSSRSSMDLDSTEREESEEEEAKDEPLKMPSYPKFLPPPPSMGSMPVPYYPSLIPGQLVPLPSLIPSSISHLVPNHPPPPPLPRPLGAQGRHMSHLPLLPTISSKNPPPLPSPTDEQPPLPPSEEDEAPPLPSESESESDEGEIKSDSELEEQKSVDATIPPAAPVTDNSPPPLPPGEENMPPVDLPSEAVAFENVSVEPNIIPSADETALNLEAHKVSLEEIGLPVDEECESPPPPPPGEEEEIPLPSMSPIRVPPISQSYQKEQFEIPHEEIPLPEGDSSNEALSLSPAPSCYEDIPLPPTPPPPPPPPLPLDIEIPLPTTTCEDTPSPSEIPLPIATLPEEIPIPPSCSDEIPLPLDEYVPPCPTAADDLSPVTSGELEISSGESDLDDYEEIPLPPSEPPSPLLQIHESLHDSMQYEDQASPPEELSHSAVSSTIQIPESISDEPPPINPSSEEMPPPPEPKKDVSVDQEMEFEEEEDDEWESPAFEKFGETSPPRIDKVEMESFENLVPSGNFKAENNTLMKSSEQKDYNLCSVDITDKETSKTKSGSSRNKKKRSDKDHSKISSLSERKHSSSSSGRTSESQSKDEKHSRNRDSHRQHKRSHRSTSSEKSVLSSSKHRHRSSETSSNKLKERKKSRDDDYKKMHTERRKSSSSHSHKKDTDKVPPQYSYKTEMMTAALAQTSFPQLVPLITRLPPERIPKPSSTVSESKTAGTIEVNGEEIPVVRYLEPIPSLEKKIIEAKAIGRVSELSDEDVPVLRYLEVIPSLATKMKFYCKYVDPLLMDDDVSLDNLDTFS